MLEPLHDLTDPRSAATMRRVISAALRRLAQDFVRLRPPSDVARSFDTVRSAFAAELAREPGRAFAVLRRANVGTMIRVVRELAVDAPRRDALWAALASTFAVELAASGAELGPIDFAHTPPWVVCLGSRLVLPGGGPARLADGHWRFGDRSIDVRARDQSAHFTPIAEPIVLSVVDDNPLSALEAHPDKSGNAVDLGDRPLSDWLAALGCAFALVEAYAPAIREETSFVLQQIVPVGAHEEKHLSASYREAIGTIYLSLHPSDMTMTEAIVHEHSHNKLNAVLELDPILENSPDERFASPVRPDARPIFGVLLAVHAFLPVAALYRRMIESGDERAQSASFSARYERIVRGNREGTELLLAHARTTALGRALLDEIAALNESFA